MGTRVLLVEDEPANQALVQETLALASGDSDFQLRVARTLAEARQAVADASFDIILLDVRLPDGNGLDLAAELKASPTTSSTRVLIVSASVLPAERDRALATGADGFLAKPFTPSALVASMESLLRS